MHLGVEGQEDRMDLEPSAADVARNTVNEDDPDNIETSIFETCDGGAMSILTRRESRTTTSARSGSLSESWC
jgi:hypothetical protein